MNAFDDPQRNLESYASSLVASIVPTIISDVGKATDPLERRVEGDLVTKPYEALKNRIPGARQTLEPKVDVLGNSIESKGNILEIMIDPTRPFTSQSTPLTRELRRLTEEGHKVVPTKLGTDKEGYKVLTPEENTRLWQRTGKLLEKKLTGLTASKGYTMADDDKRAKAIAKFVERVKIEARSEMVIEHTTGLTVDALLARLSEFKKGELLTQDVLRRVKELR